MMFKKKNKKQMNLQKVKWVQSIKLYVARRKGKTPLDISQADEP